MNLKEAFRFQNKLKDTLKGAKLILMNDGNITSTKTTYFYKKANPEAENEEIVAPPSSEYADKITEMADFAAYILGEREKLSRAIAAAKAKSPTDIDTEVSLNSDRQDLAHLYRHMADLRAREINTPNGGVGYKFNADGDQVSYRVDTKTVVSINYDRNAVKKLTADMDAASDTASAAIDAAIITAEVDYKPPFGVNDSFSSIFEDYLAKQSEATDAK